MKNEMEKDILKVLYSEEEIRAVIAQVLAGLGIEKPAPKDKGAIMKALMPRVKGKADGAVVNRLVSGLFA